MTELLYPTYFLLLIFIFHQVGTLNIQSVPANSNHPIVPTGSITSYCPMLNDGQGSSCVGLAYAPNTHAQVNQLMASLSGNNSLVGTMGFASKEALQKEVAKKTGKFWGGVVIDFTKGSTGNLYQDMSYTLRLNTSLLSDADKKQTAYLALQQSFQQALINTMVASRNMNVSLQFSTQKFPNKAVDTQFSFGILWPIYFTLMFGVTQRYLVAQLINEKIKKLKEGMRMMGLLDSAYWSSWLITTQLKYVAPMTLFLIVGYIAGVFLHSNFLILWLSMMVFAMYSTAFGSFCGAAFGTMNMALVTMSVYRMIALLLLIVSITLLAFVPAIGVSLAHALSWIGAVPFGVLWFNIAGLELAGKGLQWEDMNKGPYSPTTSFIWMLVDTGIWYLLAWYCSQVFPGEFGTPKPLTFFLDSNYWWPREDPVLQQNPGEDWGIQVMGLCKTYRKKVKATKEDVIAVTDLSFNVRKGETFAILGHNGAGKSTTFSILTGLFPATAGRAYIHGYSVQTSFDKIRTKLGVCPQHDIQFPDMTVMEHLRLFAALKGVPNDRVDSEMFTRLEQVSLEKSTHEKISKNLSGGQRRKLSLAIALIGDSEILFLDECTNGMDPYSRRQVYNLLQDIKQHKTIVMSTHYMEEADLLADRIMIMSHGQLRAMGSPLDLKKAFNVGYRLSFSKKLPESSSSSSFMATTTARFKMNDDDHTASHEDVHLALAQPRSARQPSNVNTPVVPRSNTFAMSIDPERAGMEDPIVVGIKEFIESHVGQVAITGLTSRDVTFSISTQQIANFGVFFQDLDENLDQLQISSYGLTMAGLNEVFLQIVAEDEAARNAQIHNSAIWTG